MSTNKKNVWVSPNEKGWSIKKAGNEKASKICETKKEAVKVGTQQAKNEKSELIIQNKDGKISEKNSFGNDPNPPKDKK